MSNKAYSPLGTPSTEFLGAGAVYFDYGEAGEVCIGVTKDGSDFTDNAEFRLREADGDLGAVKGAVDLIKMNPVLTVRTLKIDKTNLVKYFAGMALDDTGGTYSVLTRMTDLSSSYLTNVAFVGQNRAGQDIVIILYDVLGDGAIKLAGKKDEEIVAEVQFTATFDPATFDRTDDATYPYAIWIQKAADTTAPTVTCVPTDGATNVVITDNIVLTFSEAIAEHTMTAQNIIIMKADGTAVAGAFALGTNDTVVTFDPTASLAAGTAYIVIVTTNIEDAAGNHLAATNVFNFTTAA